MTKRQRPNDALTEKLLANYDYALGNDNGKQADFSGEKFSFLDLSGWEYGCGATFQGVKFYDSNLEGAFFNTCDFKRATFQCSNLRKLHAISTNFCRAQFFKVDLSGADLKGANFRLATFSGVDLSGADLRGADLRGIKFEEIKLTDIKVDQATKF